MSYTPPNTFVTGTVIAAADMQGNIDGIQSYANGGVVMGDLSTAAWCEQQHIVAPEYNPTTSTLQAVSGSVCEAERPTFTGRYSYAMRATSDQLLSVAAWQWVPGTVQQFILPRHARAIILQFHCGGTTSTYTTADVQGGIAKFGQPMTKLRAFLTAQDIKDVGDLDGFADLSQYTEHQVQIEADANNGALDESHAPRARRDHYSGFMLAENAVPGVYTLGLAAQSTNPKFRMWRWNVVAEAWMV